MYFKMNYTTEDGVNHPESVWIMDEVRNLSVSKKSGCLVFAGWHDITAFDTRKANIDRKEYHLNPITWDAFFALTELNLNDVFQPCYQFAQFAPEEDTGISFFADAEIIQT